MNFTSRVSERSARQSPQPAALLGADHPLVRDLERLTDLVCQVSVVAAVLAGSAGALVAGSSAAVSVVVASGITELLLACRAAVILESRRAHVLDLISQGCGELPIRSVERMRARLRSVSHRRRLGGSIGALLDGRVRSYDLIVSPWRFLRADLSGPIREELMAIRALLGEEDAGLAGIAMMERLLTDGTSSLHGDDVRRVREDLRRARVLLGLRSPGC